ncbi:MAG: class I SAM-dependent methyltransferase, partial [Acidimicrobiia bacterium]
DARALRFEGTFDAVISLCQGAFGLSAGHPDRSERLDPDLEVLAGMARALRLGGVLALTAFSAYFQVRYLGEEGRFDSARGVNYERTVLRSETGEEMEGDLWTTCYTPRELRLMAGICGLEVLHLSSVTPGEYALRPIDMERPELLLIARKVDSQSNAAGWAQ